MPSARSNRAAYFLIAPAIIILASPRSIRRFSPSRSASSTGIGASSSILLVCAITLDLFRSAEFWQVLYQTFVFAVVATALELVLGIGLAVVVDRLEFGASIIRTLLLTPLMVSGIIVALMSKIVLDPMLGIVNYVLTSLGLPPSPFFGTTATAMGTVIMVDAWWQTAFVFIIVLAGLQSLPQEPIEAARVDGAGGLQTFFRVKLPMLRPVLFTILIFRTIDTLKGLRYHLRHDRRRTADRDRSDADAGLSQSLQLSANERSHDRHGHLLRHRPGDQPRLYAPGRAHGRGLAAMVMHARRDQLERLLAYLISLAAILADAVSHRLAAERIVEDAARCLRHAAEADLRADRRSFSRPAGAARLRRSFHEFRVCHRRSASSSPLSSRFSLPTASTASVSAARSSSAFGCCWPTCCRSSSSSSRCMCFISASAGTTRHIGLALVYQVHSLPFAVWLIRSFFKEVPAELDDAARIDGCGHFKTLRHVYIPLAAPGISATAILTAIWIWNELTIALSLTFSDAQTITVAVASFRGYTSINWGQMAAASIVAIVPMLVFAVFAQKYIVKGLTLGSLKG